MIPNYDFVQAVRREQARRGDTQIAFARYLGIDQSTLSKFYANGVKPNLLTGVLCKYPHLLIYLVSEEQP